MLNGIAELQEKLMIFDNPKAELSKPTIDSVVSHASLINGVMIYDGTSVDIDDYEWMNEWMNTNPKNSYCKFCWWTIVWFKLIFPA